MFEEMTVSHCLLCRRATFGSSPSDSVSYDLLGVSYWHRTPEGVGLSPFDPYPAKSVDLFVRFLGGNGACDFEIEVRWESAPEDCPVEPYEYFGPFTVQFHEDDNSRDFLFRVTNVPLFGPGVYSFSLYRVSGIMPWESREPLAVDYIEVVTR
jgi:hypothetical protein